MHLISNTLLVPNIRGSEGGLLNWILEEQKDICGKFDEIQIKPGNRLIEMININVLVLTNVVM